MSLSIKLGNFLFRNAYGLYKPLYFRFKNRQDAYEIELLRQHIKPGDRIIDIGANIGFYALILSELTGGKGSVHAFEPDPVNFSRLQKTVEGVGNIRINNQAMAPKSGNISVYTSKELNVDHRTYKPEEFEKELVIQAVSLDDYIESWSGSKNVDFIKMDIQGFEQEALKGMTKTLENNPGVKLVSEFWPYGLEKAGGSAAAYFDQLGQAGFNCYLLENSALVLLTKERVLKMQELGKEHYFNIFATRGHV